MKSQIRSDRGHRPVRAACWQPCWSLNHLPRHAGVTTAAGEPGGRPPPWRRHGFHLEEVSKRVGHRLRAPGPQARPEARPHHAAGRLDGGGGLGGRLRPRRLARPLRHQQRRGEPQPPLPQPGRRHVRATWPSRWASPTSTSPGRASRWARSGATTTTTATRTCSSTSGAGPSCSTTTPARASPASPRRPGFPTWVNAGCATWLDYDRDGHLDLFLAGYWDERLDLWHLDDHEDDAGELRVRPERRAQIPVPQPGRRHASRT